MKFLVLLLVASVALATGAARVRDRSLVDFAVIVMCLGDVDPFEGLEYNGYGCYCGLGGSGSPLDATDSCCVVHDNCYSRSTTEAGCSSFDTYTIPYDYEKSTDTSGNCAISCNAEGDYSADDSDAKCKAFMCECDRIGAQCFADERGSFNSAYVGYDKDSC